MTDMNFGSVVSDVSNAPDADDSSSVTVLMVHGLGGTSNTFQSLMPVLHSRTVVRPDLPGAGRSPLQAGWRGMDHLVTVVADIMQSCKSRQFDLIGHSFGTLICQHLAATYPSRVRSLCLFGPILEPSLTARDSLRQRAAMARQHGMAQIADTVAQTSVSDAADARNPLCRVFVRESLMRQSANGYAMHCEALADANAADHDKIVCPVRLIVGDQDPVTPLASAQKLRASLTNANLHTLAHTGHWATIEAAAQSADLLAKHLSGL